MPLTIRYPGIQVTEATAGALPIPIASFNSIKVTGTASRGPTGLNRNAISRHGQFGEVYGPEIATSYAYDAMRAIFSNIESGGIVFFNRVVGSGSALATKTLSKVGVAQVETATVVGTIGASGVGNATVIVTSAGMSGSPITVSVAVANNDTASQVATKIRAALALNATIAARFTIGGAGATVVLTRVVAAANDATLNISIDNGTCTGLTPALTSVNTTAGVADIDVLRIDAKGPGADYNYVSSPAHGVSVKYVDGKLSVYDAGIKIEEFRNVTAANNQAASAAVNGSSNLVNITWLDTDNDANNQTSLTGLLAGADGAAVVAADIAGDSEAGTGVYQFAETLLPIGVLLAPGYPQEAVAVALEDLAVNFFHYAMVDSTFGLSDSGYIAERDELASPRGHSGYYAGWVEVPDQLNGGTKFVPQTPFRAAFLIRSQSLPGGAANVGAGLEFNLRGAVGIETDDLDDLRQGELNFAGVNVCRNFASFGQGLVAWSARTMSTNPLYTFVQVRVILNIITQSLLVGMRPFIFKPYDGKGRLAAELKGTINGLLYRIWNQGALFGAIPREAYQVKNVSTLGELDQGIVQLEVYVKPTPILERLGITLFRVPLGFNFRTGEVTEGDVETRQAA